MLSKEGKLRRAFELHHLIQKHRERKRGRRIRQNRVRGFCLSEG